MLRKRHLQLVVSNKQTPFQKFWQWLNAPRVLELPALPFIVTKDEKKKIIQDYLTLRFADHQLVTGEVGLFPLCEAMNEVEEIERQGKINEFYKHIKRTNFKIRRNDGGKNYKN